MSARRTGIDDYRSVLDPGRMRRRLLTRAALAAGVMILMLAGLLLFGDDDNSGADQTVNTAPSVAATTAPLLALPTVQLAPSAPDTPVATVAAAEAPPDVAAAPDEPAALPDPVVAGTPLASPEPELPLTDDVIAIPDEGLEADATQHALPATQDQADSAPPRSNDARPTPAAKAPSAAPIPAATGFSAHLGEYGALDEAERLRETLAKQGLPATLVRRVVLGPVSTRKAAEQIVSRLQQQRKVAGFIVADAGGKGFLVQTGVFAERGNAEAQQQHISTPARKATIQARVVLGPYATRGEAEAALAKVRGERKIAGAIVAAAR